MRLDVEIILEPDERKLVIERWMDLGLRMIGEWVVPAMA